MTYPLTKISDFCLVTDFVANGSFESLRKNVEYLDGDGYAILVRLTDFTKKWKSGFKYVSENAYKFLKHSYLLPNDLLMSNVGEPGKVFLLPDLGKPMTIGPNSILIRPKSDIAIQKFLYYYFLSPLGNESIQDITSGTTQKKFNKTSFRALEIALPPLTTQQKIVAKLDALFAEIDKAIAAAQANTKNAESLFQSYLTEVFERGGEGWVETSLQELLDRKWIVSHLDGNHGSDYPRKEEFINSGIPYISANCLDGDLVNMDRCKYLSKERASSLRKGLAKNEDVLFAHNATVGPVAILQTKEKVVILGTSLTYYRCDKQYIEPEYLANYMRSAKFKNQYLSLIHI